eukprot:c27519_g1_i1 orf=2-613(-)
MHQTHQKNAHNTHTQVSTSASDHMSMNQSYAHPCSVSLPHQKSSVQLQGDGVSSSTSDKDEMEMHQLHTHPLTMSQPHLNQPGDGGSSMYAKSSIFQELFLQTSLAQSDHGHQMDDFCTAKHEDSSVSSSVRARGLRLFGVDMELDHMVTNVVHKEWLRQPLATYGARKGELLCVDKASVNSHYSSSASCFKRLKVTLISSPT